MSRELRETAPIRAVCGTSERSEAHVPDSRCANSVTAARQRGVPPQRHPPKSMDKPRKTDKKGHTDENPEETTGQKSQGEVGQWGGPQGCPSKLSKLRLKQVRVIRQK